MNLEEARRILEAEQRLQLWILPQCRWEGTEDIIPPDEVLNLAMGKVWESGGWHILSPAAYVELNAAAIVRTIAGLAEDNLLGLDEMISVYALKA